MTLEDFLGRFGTNAEATLARFGGSRAMCAKFLHRYPGDPSFASVQEAVAGSSAEKLDHAAHSLKGVAANLGLDKLSAISAEMMNAARAGDLEGAKAFFPRLEAEHKAIIEALATLA